MDIVQIHKIAINGLITCPYSRDLWTSYMPYFQQNMDIILRHFSLFNGHISRPFFI